MANEPEGAGKNMLNERIYHLDSLTAKLEANMSAQTQDIEKLTRAFDAFRDQVSRYIQASGRPNWGWFLGGGSLIVAIMSLAASPFIRDLQRVESRTIRNADTVSEMMNKYYSSIDHHDYAQDMERRLRLIEERHERDQREDMEWRQDRAEIEGAWRAQHEERLKWVMRTIEGSKASDPE